MSTEIAPDTSAAAPSGAEINPSDFDRAPTPLAGQIPESDVKEAEAVGLRQHEKDAKGLDASLDRALAKLDAKQKAEAKAEPDAKGEKAPAKDAKGEAVEKLGKDGKPVEAKAETPEAKAARERGEQGRFVAKEQQAPQPGAEAETAVKDAAKPSEGLPHHQPPSRFIDAAKAEWVNVPESVKQETHRAFENLERGLQEHQQRAEQLRPYHELAQQNGTTLDKAMDRYISFERSLQQDLVGGLEGVVRDMTGGKMGLYEIAAHVMGMEPEQSQQQFSKAAHETNTRLERIEQSLQQQEQARRDEHQQRVHNEVLDFWAKHDDAEALAPFMAAQLRAGVSMEDAYASAKGYAADLARAVGFIAPDAASRDEGPQLTARPSPAPANPAGQKSIKGAPTAGEFLNGKTHQKGKPLPSVDATLKKLGIG